MDDSNSWRDRCDRYFTSLSENSEPKQNGHLKNKEQSNVEKRKSKTEDNQALWKNLAALRKWSNAHPVIGYIRNAVFKVDIHGAKLAGKSSHSIELLIWGIVIVAVFCFTIFMVVLQYNEYADNKTHFQTLSINGNDVHTTSMAFTVCNLNIVKKSRIKSSKLEYLINDTIDLFGNSSSYTTQTVRSVIFGNYKVRGLVEATNNGSDIVRSLEQDVVVREMLRNSNETLVTRLRETGSTSWFNDIVSLNVSDVKNFGHQLDDVIVKCFIGSRECNESNLKLKPDTKLGNCVTFPPEMTSEPVQLILNAEADEYIPGAAPSVGFKLFIHGAGNDAKEGRETVVGTNSVTSLRVKKETLVRRQDKTCIADPGSKQNCLDSCYENHVKDKCGCSLNSNTPGQPCRNDVPEILTCRKAIVLLMSKGRLLCDCQDSCSESFLDITQSVLPWPSASYMPILSSLLNRNGINFTESQIRENLVSVNLDLRPETVMIVEETKGFHILDLLAKVGGLLAFVAGMSVLTLVEIVWTILRSLSDACLYINRRSRGVEEVERLSDSDITSVTWAMYKQKRRQEELDKDFQMNNNNNNTRTDKRKGHSLTGNVNSRLHKRNGYLSSINENHNDPPEGHSDRHAVSTMTPTHSVTKGHKSSTSSGNRDYKQAGSTESYELKGGKYRVPHLDSDRAYANMNGHVTNPQAYMNGKPHTYMNGNPYNGVSLISGPYTNNNGHYSSMEPGVIVPLRERPQLPARGRYKPSNDQVQLYANTSAYFHTNVSEPTFL